MTLSYHFSCREDVSLGSGQQMAAGDILGVPSHKRDLPCPW